MLLRLYRCMIMNAGGTTRISNVRGYYCVTSTSFVHLTVCVLCSRGLSSRFMESSAIDTVRIFQLLEVFLMFVQMARSRTHTLARTLVRTHAYYTFLYFTNQTGIEEINFKHQMPFLCCDQRIYAKS